MKSLHTSFQKGSPYMNYQHNGRKVETDDWGQGKLVHGLVVIWNVVSSSGRHEKGLESQTGVRNTVV
jgi:hypothetical protein